MSQREVFRSMGLRVAWWLSFERKVCKRFGYIRIKLHEEAGTSEKTPNTFMSRLHSFRPPRKEV